MDHTNNLASDKYVSGIRKKLNLSGDVIDFVLFIESLEEIYYIKASLTTGSTAAVRIFTSIKGVGETVFIDGATETVGSMNIVRQSFTVGWTI